MKYIEILTDKAQPSTTLTSTYTPYLLSLVAAIIYPFGWIYCSEQNISIAENAILRGFICAFIHYIMCTVTSSPTNIQSPSFRLLFTRSIIMSIYSLTISLAQYILPLPIVHTINSSGMIFVFIVDYLVNRVSINVKQAVGAGVGLLGVVVTGNSRIIVSWIQGEEVEVKTDFQNYVTDDLRVIGVFMVVFVAVMFGWAYAVVLTKSIKANTYQINFVMGLIVQFSGCILYPFTNSPPPTSLTTPTPPPPPPTTPSPPTSTPYPQLLLAILFTGLPLTLSQTLYIAALKMTKNTGMISIIGFVTVGIGYLVSIFRYHETPNMVSNVGVLLALFGVWRTIFGGGGN